MPRLLNSHTTMGVGFTGVSYDNALILSMAGTPAFASSCQIVANAGSSVVSIDPATKVVAPAFPFPAPGADVVCAGAGTIAAGLTSGQYTRLRNAGGFSTLQNQTPLDVDRLGGIAITYNRQQGQNICVFFADYTGGAFPVIPTGPLKTARCLNALVSWNELNGSTWNAKGYNLALSQPIAIQTLPGNVYQPLLFNANGQTWVLYSDQMGDGHLHPITAPSSLYTIPGPCYGLDAELQPSGQWLVVWALNQGESAGSLRSDTFSL